ncbi:MAG: hypothetical protein ACFE9R_01950 [Candidatus Hermodarchaeota archaeon]
MDDRLRNALFKLFLLAIVELMCFNFFIIISAITGSFEWPLERLTSSFAGSLIQIINLVALISGMIIFVYVIIVIIYLLKN